MQTVVYEQKYQQQMIAFIISRQLTNREVTFRWK